MNVLSLFDGISCGRVALERAGLVPAHYFSSEIDKYCIQIAQKNYPDTVQLGDVINWKDWNLPTIDLLIGGPPCQGFSVQGMGLNFDDPRSKLIFEYLDILKCLKPKYWLLENVKMQKKWKDIISDLFGVQPILINSALVSAQNRERYYWTNIPGITQPENKGILLRDIIDSGVTDRDKSHAMTADWRKCNSTKNYFKKHVGQLVLCDQVGITNASYGRESIKRVYSPNGKSPTLSAMSGGDHHVKITEDYEVWRKLSPVECEHLQTLPDDYTAGVSNIQRYNMLGNGWTVDVIAHIFSFIPDMTGVMSKE